MSAHPSFSSSTRNRTKPSKILMKDKLRLSSGLNVFGSGILIPWKKRKEKKEKEEKRKERKRQRGKTAHFACSTCTSMGFHPRNFLFMPRMNYNCHLLSIRHSGIGCPPRSKWIIGCVTWNCLGIERVRHFFVAFIILSRANIENHNRQPISAIEKAPRTVTVQRLVQINKIITARNRPLPRRYHRRGMHFEGNNTEKA